MNQKKLIYRIRFFNQGTVYEIYARSIAESEIFGFIEVDHLIFGETTSIVVDPSEERLKSEFADVRCIFIPTHSIVRIDVVEKEGIAKVVPTEQTNGVNNVSMFPQMLTSNHHFNRKPDTSE